MKINLHPLLDLSGVAIDAVDAMKNGAPFVATTRIKREGQIYKPGDELLLGSIPGDAHIAREGMALPKARYEAKELAHLAGEYERDVLQPARKRVADAQRTANAAAAQAAALEAQLTAANALVQTTQGNAAKVASELATLEKALPNL